jgi:hypothetical protein
VLGTSSIVLDAVIIVGISVAISMAVLWTIRWAIPHERLTPHNEVSGFVYAVIGVIYAIILGFAVITVWEHYNEAKSDAHAEANAVANIYRIASGLPEPSRGEIQDASLAYVSTVAEKEWAAMDDGTAPVQQAVDDINTLWSSFDSVALTTSAEEALYAEGLNQLSELSSLRRERLEDNDAALLGIMWGVVVGGAILTVLFPCLFGVESRLVHSLIIGTLAASIGLLLLLTYDLNYPFNGDVAIGPGAFERVLEQFSAEGQSAFVGFLR